MKRSFLSLTIGAIAAVGVSMGRLFGPRESIALHNAIDTGTHFGPITKVADAAIARNLLVRMTSATNVDLCGASQRPLGVASENETSASTQRIPVNPMALTGTKILVASEPIAVDAEIYTAASGKVQDLPAAAGTYFRVGRALTSAAADGDPIEVETHAPIRVVVLANAADLAALKAAATAPCEIMYLGA